MNHESCNTSMTTGSAPTKRYCPGVPYSTSSFGWFTLQTASTIADVKTRLLLLSPGQLICVA